MKPQTKIEAPDKPGCAASGLLGRHLSNISDHRRPHAEMMMLHSLHDVDNGPQAMHAAWLRRLEWINSNVIGPPKATEHYTQAQLEEMGMIGIYAPAS